MFFCISIKVSVSLHQKEMAADVISHVYLQCIDWPVTSVCDISWSYALVLVCFAGMYMYNAYTNCKMSSESSTCFV